MHVKFLGRGSGSAGAAAEYLLEERNAAGEEREEVEVLRGDPWRVAEVADSLEFEYRYTSGVNAWAPEDEPSDDQIEQTLESSSARPGQGSRRSATPGRRCCIGRRKAAYMCMCWRRGVISRPARA